MSSGGLGCSTCRRRRIASASDMTVFAGSSFASDAGNADYTENLNVAIAPKGTKVIDGNLDDWANVPGVTAVGAKEKIDAKPAHRDARAEGIQGLLLIFVQGQASLRRFGQRLAPGNVGRAGQIHFRRDGDEPEAAQIILGPSGGLQDAPKGLAGEGVAAGMVVDDGPSAVGVAVDPAAGPGLAF